MQIDALDVPGAWLCTPTHFPDDRGVFLEWFRGESLAEATGRTFATAQANLSVSRRGVLRGLHFADVPPSQSKIVCCPSGAVLDVVVDVRAGSPTYGRVATAVLDDVDRRVMVIAEGLAHGFCALRDETVVSYLVSASYRPGAEHGIDPLDPALAIPWPDDLGGLVLSGKDAAAPSLAAASDLGLLPSYDDCLALYSSARRPGDPTTP